MPDTEKNPFSKIEDAIQDIRLGKMVVVVDDEDRENEGDLVMSGEMATPESVTFMATLGRGLICAPLSARRADELDLELLPQKHYARDRLRTAFTVSVDARAGTTTGISAADRSNTIRKLADPASTGRDFIRPGHVFPLRARPGGVLERAGHTEAAVDLTRLAGLTEAGVICEIMRDDGEMARLPDLIEFCRAHGLKLITIKDLIAHRARTEKLVRKVASAKLPTRYGDFTVLVYEDRLEGKEHLALVRGHVAGRERVLVRVHSECLTGDVFGSSRCDCGDQLAMAMMRIEKEPCGVLLYIRQEGRGIGLKNKIMAYALQDDGLDTVEANERLGFPPDLRTYGVGAQILADIGLTTIRLLTNNPKKIVGLEGFGLKVVEQMPIQMEPTAQNLEYLRAKKEKLGHMIRGL